MSTASRQLCTGFCCLLLACFALTACDGDNNMNSDMAVAPGALPAVCTDCGQIKGTDSCCAADAEVCAGCGLHAGSPGCCKIEKGSDHEYHLCTKCGHFAGSEMCCAEGQTMCEGCGLVAGSPGCCKIE